MGLSYEVKHDVHLWKNLEKAMGSKYVPHNQIDKDDSESEGDCLGHATALGCDCLAASDIHFRREPEKWVAKASVEAIYWGSRYEIGRPLMDPKDWAQMSKHGGSVGEWAAIFVKEYGVLHRRRYRVGRDAIDLRGYDPGRSRERRSTGVPDWLEPIARQHPVKQISNVKSGLEALDSVVAGNPVVLCSSYAFPEDHDSDGWTTPYLGRMRKRWFHAMLLAGFVLVNGERGGVILNSHGDWNDTASGMPTGGIMVKEKYLDMMVKNWYDCWSLAGYVGHQVRNIRKHLLYVRGMGR
jgi:hypothetical protein